MSNPLRILRLLDHHLTVQSEITLFGRAALALGYADAPVHFHNTHDVDGILPVPWLEAADENQDFWLAVQRTNAELEPDGLYVTHLFREVDVILQADWYSRRVSLNLDLAKLMIFRPATIDLIVTKMARGDEEDLQDIAFLLKQEPIGVHELKSAFGRARIPDVPEIEELFRKAKPKVLQLAEQLHQ
jgi:hypothetical protein